MIINLLPTYILCHIFYKKNCKENIFKLARIRVENYRNITSNNNKIQGNIRVSLKEIEKYNFNYFDILL